MLPSIHDFFRATVRSRHRIAVSTCGVLFFLCVANAAADHPATSTGVLPSEKPSRPAPAQPQEILAEVGIGPAELEKLQHTKSILQQSDSRSVVLQILYRLAGMPLRIGQRRIPRRTHDSTTIRCRSARLSLSVAECHRLTLSH